MQKQAIIEKLAQGSHLVTFTKKSGDVTSRELTLDPNLVPRFEAKTDRITKQSESTIRAWDLTSLKFISLIPENVQDF